MELYRHRQDRLHWSKAIPAALEILRGDTKQTYHSLERVKKVVFVNCLEDNWQNVAEHMEQNFKQESRYIELAPDSPSKNEYRMMMATPFGKCTMRLLKENPKEFGKNAKVERILIDLIGRDMVMEILKTKP